MNVNDLQSAAEQVADRLIDSLAPEWVEFLLDHADDELMTALVRGVKGSAQELYVARGVVETYRTRFIEALVSNHDPRHRWSSSLHTEVRRYLPVSVSA